MFEYATHVVAVSNDMKKALIKLGCPESKIKLNPYGPRNEFFDIKPQFEEKKFLAVGRFVDKKAPYLNP